jgi:hypothetical protein
MSTTVAVAIITALATISGASVAGIINLIAQGRQIGLQRETLRRQARRDAYMEYLLKWDEIIEVLDSIWKSMPPSDAHANALEPLSLDFYTRLRTAINAVYLEGPTNVIRVADHLAELIAKERKIIDRLAQENIGNSGRLTSFTSRKDIVDARIEARNAFVAEAAKALKRDSELQVPCGLRVAALKSYFACRGPINAYVLEHVVQA